MSFVSENEGQKGAASHSTLLRESVKKALSMKAEAVRNSNPCVIDSISGWKDDVSGY
jgi:hypothetical protein